MRLSSPGTGRVCDTTISSRNPDLSPGCLEVANALAILHRRLAGAVVGPRLAALGDVRRRDLGDDLFERRRRRADAAGAAHVADGAEAHGLGERLLVGIALDVVADGVEHPVAPEHLARVGEVD